MDAPTTMLAELEIRHTRRHMPTRRVALGRVYLPTAGGAAGADLLAAVVREFVPRIDEDTRPRVAAVVDLAAEGRLVVPSLHLLHRLQTDTHGLDRSVHRLADDGEGIVCELDLHGRPEPQVLGALMAIAAMPTIQRAPALDAVRRALRRPGIHPPRWRVVRRAEARAGARPDLAAPAAPESEPLWTGLDADLRWAMEVLGLGPGTTADRAEVQRRYRRLVRAAHPDGGGERTAAAERLASLAEARSILLAVATG